MVGWPRKLFGPKNSLGLFTLSIRIRLQMYMSQPEQKYETMLSVYYFFHKTQATKKMYHNIPSKIILKINKRHPVISSII